MQIIMCDAAMDIVESLRANNIRLARLVSTLTQELEEGVEQLSVQATEETWLGLFTVGGLALRNPVLCLWFLSITRDQVAKNYKILISIF